MTDWSRNPPRMPYPTVKSVHDACLGCARESYRNRTERITNRTHVRRYLRVVRYCRSLTDGMFGVWDDRVQRGYESVTERDSWPDGAGLFNPAAVRDPDDQPF